MIFAFLLALAAQSVNLPDHPPQPDGWCYEGDPVPATHQISGTSLWTLRPQQVAEATERLASANFVTLSRQEAKAYLGSRQDPSDRYIYLIRSAIAADTDAKLEKRTAELPSFIGHQARWNPEDKSFQLTLLQPVDFLERTVEHKVPMILLSPVQISRMYLVCVAYS